MRRTQIYLPEYQIHKLRATARRRQISISQLIRATLDRELIKTPQKKEEKMNAGEWLLQMAKKFEKYKVSGPKDLAKDMDKYLYDRDFR